MWHAIVLTAFYNLSFQWMICINTNASTKFRLMSKLWTISWSPKGAGRVCGHHVISSVYALWNAGSTCPASFKGKPGLMSHSVKANSVIIFHFLSSGATKMVKKSCLLEIFSRWLFISPVSNFRRISMTFQSHLMPDPHLSFSAV